jgi:hypothetical protein
MGEVNYRFGWSEASNLCERSNCHTLRWFDVIGNDPSADSSTVQLDPHFGADSNQVVAGHIRCYEVVKGLPDSGFIGKYTYNTASRLWSLVPFVVHITTRRLQLVQESKPETTHLALRARWR